MMTDNEATAVLQTIYGPLACWVKTTFPPGRYIKVGRATEEGEWDKAVEARGMTWEGAIAAARRKMARLAQ